MIHVTFKKGNIGSCQIDKAEKNIKVRVKYAHEYNRLDFIVLERNNRGMYEHIS